MNELVHPEDVTIEKASATWKFDFLDTVNADPQAKGGCLAVIKAYTNFASKARPYAFCALPELMIRTGLTRPTLIKARSTLERLGYLVPQYETEGGATMYLLVNARKQTIDEHLIIARQALTLSGREKKALERRSSKCRGKETLPPKSDEGERNFTPFLKETLPNTLEEYPGVIIIEGKTVRQQVSETNPYLLASSGEDLTIPFEAPQNEDDARAFIANAGAFPALIEKQLVKMLMAGQLTPLMLSADLGRKRA